MAQHFIQLFPKPGRNLFGTTWRGVVVPMTAPKEMRTEAEAKSVESMLLTRSR